MYINLHGSSQKLFALSIQEKSNFYVATNCGEKKAPLNPPLELNNILNPTIDTYLNNLELRGVPSRYGISSRSAQVFSKPTKIPIQNITSPSLPRTRATTKYSAGKKSTLKPRAVTVSTSNGNSEKLHSSRPQAELSLVILR